MLRKLLVTTVAASGTLAALVPAAEARPRVYKSTWEAHAKIGGTGIVSHALLRQRDGALVLALRVTGLAADSRHAVHVHAGSCAAQGAVVVPVPDLIANGRGVGRMWIALPTDPGVDVAETGYYVNVHQGFGASTAGVIRTRFWGAAVARGCDCAPAAWLPQNMGTEPCPYPQSAP